MNFILLLLIVVTILGGCGWIGLSLMEKSKTHRVTTEKYVTNDFYYYNKSLIDVVACFIIITGIIFAIPFINLSGYEEFTWEVILSRIIKACGWECVNMFICFIPILWRKKHLEKAEYTLKKAFLDGALKYGVNTGHFHEHPIHYRVAHYYLSLESSSYYMYRWTTWGYVDEFILTNTESGEEIRMSMEHLWRRLRPIVRGNHEVFPWEVNWEKGAFPKKEYNKWIKAGGGKLLICK